MDGPGLGIELNEDTVKKYQYSPTELTHIFW
jgi:L-alanine-DL-glutamate epimerase-like enolase superfamily enzyme